MNTIFHSTPGFAGNASNIYSASLGQSNDLGGKQAVVGMFGVPSSYGSWQQPVTAPPSPVPGFKGVAPDQNIVPRPRRTTPQFSPATNYDPYQAY